MSSQSILLERTPNLIHRALAIGLLTTSVLSVVGCSPSGAGFVSALSSLGTQPITSSTTEPTNNPTANQPANPTTGLTSGSAPSVPVVAVPTPVATPVPRASNEPNLVVCGGTSTVMGTDVAHYDSGTNWAKAAAGGLGFTFIKATEGTDYTNPLFSGDWAASRANGLFRGAYHFFHPGDDPTLQAKYFLETIGTLEANDLGPVLDFEVTDGVSASQQVSNALIWLNLVETATGKTPIVYVDPSFFNDLGNPESFAKYPLYIANYDTACPSVPPPWTTWTFWQKSETATVPGLTSSQADLDVFNGTIKQLGAFAVPFLDLGQQRIY